MNDTGESDEALLAAYAAGDAAAFTRLYDRHERPVFRYFLRQGQAVAQAEDLLQETFLAVIRGAPRFTPSARFTTWLYTIARNKLIDQWRASGRVESLDDAANDPEDAQDESALDRLPAAESTQPEVDASSREYARAFLGAVEALPAAQRDAFLMHAEGELSLDEIAAVASVGVETVKSRLRYAMRRLRVACATWLPEEPDRATDGRSLS